MLMLITMFVCLLFVCIFEFTWVYYSLSLEIFIFVPMKLTTLARVEGEILVFISFDNASMFI